VNARRVAQLIRVLRVRHRLTQEMLARRAGVSRTAVSLIERGRVREQRVQRVRPRGRNRDNASDATR